MTGQNLDWEAQKALKDHRLSSEITVRPISRNTQPRKYSMTMDEVREIDKKRRETIVDELILIWDIMES